MYRHFTKRIESSLSDLSYLERLAVDLEPLELCRIKSDLTMYVLYKNLAIANRSRVSYIGPKH